MKQKVFTLMTLLVLCVTGAWAQTTYTYTGYTTEIAKQFTHDYGDTYVGRINNSYTPAEGGLPTGNSNIFAAFQVTESSKIKVVFVWTKTNGDLTGKSIALASIDKTKFDKLALASTSTDGSVKYSDVSFSTSQTKTVEINRSQANTEVEFEFDAAVGAGYYAVYTASSINASALIKKIVVTPHTTYELTFANAAGATGVVPAAMPNASGTITLPKNTSMWYADGYTMTKWVDESDNEYAPGSEYTVTGNQTLTAKFEGNTVDLNDRTLATTIKWGSWNQSLGVPSLHFEGSSGFVVSQASVAGKTIDVKLPIDATTGKFKNQASNDWTQVNPGVVFTIPAADGATITYKQRDNSTESTPEATATGNTYALTSAGTSGKLYYEYIQVVLPGPTYTVTNTLTNVTKVSGEATVMGGTEYTATFVGADGYGLPASVTVTAGGADITANCTWSAGTLTIPAAYTTGNIVITINGVALAGSSIIKATMTSATAASVTGTIGGTATASTQNGSGSPDANGGYKFGGSGYYIGITLADGTFKTGDIINVHVTTASGQGTIAIYATSGKKVTPLYDTETKGVVGDNKFVLPAAINGKSTIYICRTDDNNWNGFVKFIEVTRPNAVVTLNASGYATYSKATDFTFLGAKAFKMALDEDAKTIAGTEVSGKIAAGEGILLKGEASAPVAIMETTGAAALVDNDLKGSTMSDGNLADKPTYCYVLSGDTFKKFTGATLTANKAYFEATGDLGGHALTMTFDDGETTAIKAIEAKKVENGVFYNLAGQQVAQPTKGLYIVNGKKVVLK